MHIFPLFLYIIISRIQADDHEPAKPTFFVAGETTDDLEDSTTVPSSAIPVPVDLATSGEGLCDSV